VPWPRWIGTNSGACSVHDARERSGPIREPTLIPIRRIGDMNRGDDLCIEIFVVL